MSSRATGISSFTHVYCCLSRDPQALCSRLNEMARLASVAEKSLTGMETSPNDTVNDAIERAAMRLDSLLEGRGGTDCNTSRFFKFWRAQTPSPGSACG